MREVSAPPDFSLPSSMRDVLTEARPSMRGRLHQIVFYFSIPAGLVVVALGGSATARFGALVYACTLSAMFATSAGYHRAAKSLRGRMWMRRADHAVIFVLIAGTYTPVCLLVLSGGWRLVSLMVVWAGALAGVGLKLLCDRAMRVGNSLYLVLGWAVLALVPQVWDRPAVLALLATGGLLYTAGTLVLARRRPDPVPEIFGYHEVWHSLVVAAAACHYSMILLLVLET